VVAQSVCLNPQKRVSTQFPQRIVPLLNVLEGGTAKITDVRIDQLLPCQGSRTSLRRSHRSHKQNQPGFRRLRSERYPYQ
jgi:hypothetical protein